MPERMKPEYQPSPRFSRKRYRHESESGRLYIATPEPITPIRHVLSTSGSST